MAWGKISCPRSKVQLTMLLSSLALAGSNSVVSQDVSQDPLTSKVFSNPSTPTRAAALLRDHDVEAAIELLEIMWPITLSAPPKSLVHSARNHQVSDSFSGENSNVDINLPCKFYGTMRAVAPWAAPYSTPYNTTWDVEIPIDLRDVSSWPDLRAGFLQEMAELCSSASMNTVLTGNMTPESCLESIMGQLDQYVSLVCSRPEGKPCENHAAFCTCHPIPCSYSHHQPASDFS